MEYKLIESGLKTSSSRRTIDLDPHTVTQLRLHRRQQLDDRMATATQTATSSPNPTDRPSTLTIGQTFERLLAKLDLPRIRLHDLRHTHATILLQQDINPTVVSERLGHASVSFTMDVYQHVLPTCKPNPPPPSEPPYSETSSRCTRGPPLRMRHVGSRRRASPLSAPTIKFGNPHTDLDSMIFVSLSPQRQIGGNSQAVSDTRVKMVRTEWVAPTVRSRTIGARMASD